MAADKQTRDLAKKLVMFSMDNGEISADKVKEVLGALSAQPPRKLKKLLVCYQKLIEREIDKYTAQVEHAGPLSQDALDAVKSFLEENSGRKISIQTQENPDLLAGIRVSLGDDVYEDSAAFRLRPLAEKAI